MIPFNENNDFASRLLLLLPGQTGSSSACMLQCEEARQNERSGDDDGGEEYYVPMPLPARAEESTHAIFGALLKKDFVEFYRVRRLAAAAAAVSAGTTTTTPGRRMPPVVVADAKLGRALDGHPGVVHGGVLALLIDDVLGFGYEALGIPWAVTANLTVDYRSGVPAGSAIRIFAFLVERKGRKLVWKVKVVSPDADEDDAVLYCEASSVYVIPREVYKSMDPEQRQPSATA